MYPNPYESPDLNLPPKGFSSRCYIWLGGANQTIPNIVFTLLALNTRLFDTLREFSTAVGIYSFTPLRAGYYLINVKINWMPNVAAGTVAIRLYYGATIRNECWEHMHAGQSLHQELSIIDYLTPSDIVTVRVYQNSGIVRDVAGDFRSTFFCTHRLS